MHLLQVEDSLELNQGLDLQDLGHLQAQDLVKLVKVEEVSSVNLLLLQALVHQQVDFLDNRINQPKQEDFSDQLVEVSV